jgi:hypothetical protein
MSFLFIGCIEATGSTCVKASFETLTAMHSVVVKIVEIGWCWDLKLVGHLTILPQLFAFKPESSRKIQIFGSCGFCTRQCTRNPQTLSLSAFSCLTQGCHIQLSSTLYCHTFSSILMYIGSDITEAHCLGSYMRK